MVRLTVLYNLAPGMDEAEFLRWRLGEVQEENAAAPGVVRTDFCIVQEAWPEGTTPRYRFMTTADWPDMESFRAAFYAPEMQEGLRRDAHVMQDATFLISEIAAVTA